MARQEQQPEPPIARDVVDGIPDRAVSRPAWKYVLLAIAFLAWLGVLVGLYYWGRP